MYSLPAAVDPSHGDCVIKFHSLKGSNLPASDLSGTSDPYVEFISPYLPGFRVKTETIPNTLDPTWRCGGSRSQVPPLKLLINNRSRIQKQFLLVRVWDRDRGSADDLLGSGTIPFSTLSRCKQGKNLRFAVDLTMHGLPAGKLEGEWSIHFGRSDFRPKTPLVFQDAKAKEARHGKTAPVASAQPDSIWDVLPTKAGPASAATAGTTTATSARTEMAAPGSTEEKGGDEWDAFGEGEGGDPFGEPVATGQKGARFD